MKLFEPAKIGKTALKNRVVMSPMTRCRAINNIPNDLMATYYSLRTDAGLLITEGTSPSPNGLGYARIPGCYNDAQRDGWKKVTQAVHDKGGKIFLQIMHCGRISHPLNMSAEARILAPSAIKPAGQMWTDQQAMQDFPVPTEMSAADIKATIAEFIHCADTAIQAGFDGVELHGANGYLIEQFLNPGGNTRNDDYGGSVENRLRFAVEVAAGVAAKIGANRVGMRISPYGAFNDLYGFEGTDAFYGLLAEKLSALGLAHIHVVDHSGMGAPKVSDEVKQLIRKNFKGTYILSGNYNAQSAEQDLAAGKGDLVAFGRPFLANPDLVQKMKDNSALAQPDPTKFYTPGPDGYTIF